MDIEKRTELKKRLLAELKELQDVRRETEADRAIAAQLCYPRREQFVDKEKAKLNKIYTAKGKLALNTAVLGIMGNMISSTVDWFSCELDTDEDQDSIYGLKDWLENLRKKIKKEFDSFGLYQAVMLALTDACAQGTSAMLILDDVEGSRVRYKVIEPEEFYIKDDENGEVERFYREYDLTAIDALEFFGDENCPEIAEKYKENPYSTHSFIHAIFPRKDRDPFNLNVENKKIASVYYSATDDAIVKETGFDEFPVVVHRWVKDSSYAYGGCPAFDCLESLKIYNKAWNNFLKQDDLLTNPPMVAPSSSRGRFSLVPGKINYIDGVTSRDIQPIYNGSNHNIMKDLLDTIIQEIDSAFHTDYFKMLVNREKQMTAREVIEVLGERASILVPVVERMQKEVMVPIVKRQFSIMKAAGRIPDPPPMIKKKDIKLEVSIQGPLSQAMKKYHEAEGVMRALEVANPIIQMFPGAEDNINTDELMRVAMDSSGMPAKIIMEVDDVKKVREAKREAMEKQQAIEQEKILSESNRNNSQAAGNNAQRIIAGSQAAALGAFGK